MRIMAILKLTDLYEAPLARGYNWHITIDGFPGWFPVHTVNDTPFSFELDEVEYGPFSYPFPKKAGRGNMDIELYELDDYRIFKFLEDWYKLIKEEDGYGIALISQAAKQVNFFRLDSNRNIVINHTFSVLLDGEVSYSYSSDHDSIVSVGLNFKIVGP